MEPEQPAPICLNCGGDVGPAAVGKCAECGRPYDLGDPETYQFPCLNLTRGYSGGVRAGLGLLLIAHAAILALGGVLGWTNVRSLARGGGPVYQWPALPFLAALFATPFLLFFAFRGRSRMLAVLAVVSLFAALFWCGAVFALLHFL